MSITELKILLIERAFERMKTCQTLYLINFDANSTFTFTLALDIDAAGGSALYWSLGLEV